MERDGPRSPVSTTKVVFAVAVFSFLPAPGASVVAQACLTKLMQTVVGSMTDVDGPIKGSTEITQAVV